MSPLSKWPRQMGLVLDEWHWADQQPNPGPTMADYIRPVLLGYTWGYFGISVYLKIQGERIWSRQVANKVLLQPMLPHLECQIIFFRRHIYLKFARVKLQFYSGEMTEASIWQQCNKVCGCARIRVCVCGSRHRFSFPQIICLTEITTIQFIM